MSIQRRVFRGDIMGEQLVCEFCDSTEDVVETLDPSVEESVGALVNICEACYEERSPRV